VDEVFWTNTFHFTAPVTQVDGQEIGDGLPGPTTERLLEAHGDRAGLDIAERYLSHLDPEDRPDTLQLGGERRST
jgi:branched-chain amino acid aminotransferase